MDDSRVKVIAVDFDGTLVKNEYPQIGTPILATFDLCKRAQERGLKVILWTCRTGELLQNAIDFCESRGLVFDAVNDNVDEVKAWLDGKPRKIYADLYIDDRSALPGSQAVSLVACLSV
jgi:hypothetical protein